MNARFANKALLKSDYATLKALIDFYEKGGSVTVCKPSKRNLAKSPLPVKKAK